MIGGGVIAHVAGLGIALSVMHCTTSCTLQRLLAPSRTWFINFIHANLMVTTLSDISRDKGRAEAPLGKKDTPEFLPGS